MYLKSIEAQGFKSFAHKIRLEFQKGITAIVGPNGSGKSNVADAMRWVLGEQSPKQLRGGAMQDVIFSGTENRRPLSYAAVSITLDNSDHALPSDYTEITVTRKLYRSGESEYLLNGSPCRLKDISELFCDTGVGREGYSIIDRSQVDRILSGKPEEKRELFDEAAGIVKYKRRKEFALKKIADERENLTRVDDIISELEKQAAPLKAQSEKAKEYLNKKEDLKNCEINIFLLTAQKAKKQIADIDGKIKIASDELKEAKAEYGATKSEYERIEEEAEIIDSCIESAREKFSQTTLLKQRLESRIEVLKEQINTLRGREENFSERKKAAEAGIEAGNSEREKLINELKGLEGQLQGSSLKGRQAEGLLCGVRDAIAENSAKSEGRRAEMMKLLKDRAFFEAKLQNLDAEEGRLLSGREKAGSKIKEDARKEADALKELTILQESVTAVSDKIAKKRQALSRKEGEAKDIQRRLAAGQENLKAASASYQKAALKLGSLKNIAERYEGYGGSIRHVMSKKPAEKGLIGVVSDIIETDREYELATETALGGSIQNIVTDNEQTAKRMIEFLKENKFGRATFLPLTAIRPALPMPRPEVLKERGVIGPADLLVRTEDKFKALVSFLLGRTIVVDDIDNAILVARKYRQSLRLVTLQGELISPGGSMTGGAFKNAGNLLGRRREISELAAEVKILKDKAAQCGKEVSGFELERSGHYRKIEEMRDDLAQESAAENEIKIRAERAKARLDAAKGALAGRRKEISDIEAALKSIAADKDETTRKAEESKKREDSLQVEIDALQEALKAARDIEAKHTKAAQEAHLTDAGIKQRQGFAAENLKRVEEGLEKLRKELKESDAGKEDTVRRIGEKEEEISDLEKSAGASEEIFKDIDLEIASYTAKKEALAERHKDFFRKREELSQRMAELDRECFRQKGRAQSLNENYEKLADYMWEEYEVTYNNALKICDKSQGDIALLKKQAAALKSGIKGLGPVNVNAIEDYKAVSGRYGFMKAQRDDIAAAEASLMKVISELDNAMKKRFREQFGMISKEFDTVFKQLFGGGSGTLTLTEDGGILDAGIRVEAQPPGKRLQNMMQLSGGEKSLSAISLLFAIQRLRPSPFCILDEIEAALDDNNAARFAKYLQKLSKNTQFIIITHRKGSMACADRLYGITMQEKGVSSLVSVDLIEDEAEKQ